MRMNLNFNYNEISPNVKSFLTIASANADRVTLPPEKLIFRR